MSGFIDIFGGSPVQPSEVGFLPITLTANTAFSWPQNNNDNSLVVAQLMEVTATGSNFQFQLPDATQVSPGQYLFYRNVGSNAFLVTDISGNTVQSVAAGTVYMVYVTNNSTANGTWSSIALGIGTSATSASNLAGYGLLAIGSTLNLEYLTNPKNANYELLASDRASIVMNTGGSVTFSFDTPTNLGTGWFALVKNSGTGALTLQPTSGQIDGSTSIILNQNDSCIVSTNGTNFYTVGLGRSFIQAITRISIPVGGNTDITLTTAQAAYNIIEFTGALTGNINIIVPNAVAQWYMFNNTTGAFTLQVKTVAGTGIFLPTGQRNNFLCDGTNVVLAQTLPSYPVPSIVNFNDTYTPTILQNGTIFVGSQTSNGPKTFSLPAANSVSNGFFYDIVWLSNISFANQTLNITPAGADTFNPSGIGSGGVLNLPSFSMVRIISDGISAWLVDPFNVLPQTIGGGGAFTNLIITSFFGETRKQIQFIAGQSANIGAGANAAITFSNAFAVGGYLWGSVTSTQNGSSTTVAMVTSNTQLTIYNTGANGATFDYIVMGVM